MRPALLLAGWLGALALLAVVVPTRLQTSGDLRLFMPDAQTADQRLLLATLGEGPASRLLLVALRGGPPERLAERSSALRAALAERPELRRVSNGEDDPEAIDQALLPYRYLLSPASDAAPLELRLRAELQARLQDLGSPAAALVEPWIARDPTLELLRLAEQWAPPLQPERFDGVWLSRDRSTALLVVETAQGGFDPQAQRAALDAINAEFAALERSAATDRDSTPGADADGPLELEVSGPGAFSVLLAERTRAEATQLGLAASIGILLLLGFAYRGLRLPLLGALPLASAALVGLAAVSLLFGSVHGITLAFGFTLLGLAQDYPVHLFSHLQRQNAAAPAATMQALWPTLLAGVVSTCLGYLSFLASGVRGLEQLAVFAISGLLVAAACTRWLLPPLLAGPHRDVADSRLLAALAARLQRWPRPRWPLALLALVAGALLVFSPRPMWDDDLGQLIPVPAELIARDGRLRAELGAPDVRFLLVLEADDRESLLQASEALQPALESLVERGVLDGFELPSRYLPSARTQRARQAALPTADALGAALAAASADLPFKRGLFAPFLADVERARELPPLDAARLADSPLGARLESLLPPTTPNIGLVSLSGVHDPAALAAFAAGHGDALHLLDLKGASESLTALYRGRVLLALVAAVLLLVGGLWFTLRSPARVVKVLLPVLLASVVCAALLRAGGVSFNLFHLVALILATGLGLDYALFFERAADDPAEQRRTLHAVLLCLASTVLVFALLATSAIPVLRAIGLTVALGVLLQFIGAAWWAGGGRDARA